MQNPFPVLIVEDDPVSRMLLERTLTKAGCEVTSVEDGRKALALFEERFFPIVITDWMMPEMDGLALCRALRKNISESYVFIFFLTAKNSKDDMIAGLEAGADDYLTKPFDRLELFARLKTAIRVLELEKSLREANEAIRLLSITDTLTGCYNRAYMDAHLSEEITRAGRYRRPISIAMVDIDHFKEVNDTYGHQAGDNVLKALVQTIRSSIRDAVDWIARYGGEEFIVVFPETGFEGVVFLGERLRKQVAELIIPFKGKEIQVTASFGITGFSTPDSVRDISHEAMIGIADKFLYQAKQDGRNRVRGKPIEDFPE